MNQRFVYMKIGQNHGVYDSELRLFCGFGSTDEEAWMAAQMADVFDYKGAMNDGRYKWSDSIEEFRTQIYMKVGLDRESGLLEA